MELDILWLSESSLLSAQSFYSLSVTKLPASFSVSLKYTFSFFQLQMMSWLSACAFGTSSTSTSQFKGELLWHSVSTLVRLNLFVKRFCKWGHGADKNIIQRAMNDLIHNSLLLKHIQYLSLAINTSGKLQKKIISEGQLQKVYWVLRRVSGPAFKEEITSYILGKI